MRIKIKIPFYLWLLYGAIIIVGGLVAYKAWLAHQYRSDLFTPYLGEFIGPADAEKTLVEYIDYRCAMCREVHKVVKEFAARNPDVRIIYRHLPIYGRISVREADLALAAAIQGKFEAVHDYLMARDQPVSEDEISLIARQFELDEKQLQNDMSRPAVGKMLLFAIDSAQFLGVDRTPTFVAGKEIYAPENDVLPTVTDLENLVARAYK